VNGEVCKKRCGKKKKDLTEPALLEMDDKRAAGQKIGNRITLFAAALEAAPDGEEQTQTDPENDPQTAGS